MSKFGKPLRGRSFMGSGFGIALGVQSLCLGMKTGLDLAFVDPPM